MTEQLKPELLACAHCGNKALMLDRQIGVYDFNRVECSGCGMQTKHTTDKKDCVALWNRRVEKQSEHDFVTRKDAERNDSAECIKCWKKYIEEK